MATISAERPLAVVTGASSGIGYELAKQFAQNGFDLLIAAEDDAIQRAAQELRPLTNSVEARQIDLANYAGVEELYGAIQSLGRPLDAIAINAGIGSGGNFATDTSLDTELNLVNLNVTSAVHLAKRVAADMVQRGRGRILFTASIAGIMPSTYEAVYGASKAFLLSFSASLHSELKSKGVSVTALMPGPTDTNFFHRAGMDDTRAGAKEKYNNDPADVARQGFEALMAGRERVVAASLGTKLQGALARFIPESIKAQMHRSLSAPGSARH